MLARAQELCESRGGGRPGLPVPNSPYGLCGRKTLNIELELLFEFQLIIYSHVKTKFPKASRFLVCLFLVFSFCFVVFVFCCFVVVVFMSLAVSPDGGKQLLAVKRLRNICMKIQSSLH